MLGKGIGVDNDGAPFLQLWQRFLQRRRIHGHQNAGRVARGKNILVGKLHLKTANAGQRSRRRPDFRRKVRHGADVVTKDGRGIGKLRPGQLHPITGVPGKADDNGIYFFDHVVMFFAHEIILADE